MLLKYRVHRASAGTAEHDVTLKSGETVRGTIAGFILELVPSDGMGGTLTHPFIGAAAKEAQANFVEGDEIEIELHPAPQKAKE